MKPFEKLKKKVALVGFAPTTRDSIPWDDEAYEIWTLNEAGNITVPTFAWVKRFDRLFQMHPRWDFSRQNNPNDPNHFHWLRNESAPCVLCKGTGELGTEVKTKCPVCEAGQYTPPVSRSWAKVIYMQEQHADIPGSVKYPLKQMIEMNPKGPYFDSSLAYMLQLACAMGYEEVKVCGFEMAAQTEYFYQRANFEMLYGWWTAKGANIVIPPGSSLLNGPLYGYENMKTGYRQNLDMRIAVLSNELTQHNAELAKLEGQMETWNEIAKLITLTPELLEGLTTAKKKYGKVLGLVNLVNGAKYEAENLRKLYDTYFMGNAEDGRTTVREDTEQYVKTIYGTE